MKSPTTAWDDAEWRLTRLEESLAAVSPVRPATTGKAGSAAMVMGDVSIPARHSAGTSRRMASDFPVQEEALLPFRPSSPLPSPARSAAPQPSPASPVQETDTDTAASPVRRLATNFERLATPEARDGAAHTLRHVLCFVALLLLAAPQSTSGAAPLWLLTKLSLLACLVVTLLLHWHVSAPAVSPGPFVLEIGSGIHVVLTSATSVAAGVAAGGLFLAATICDAAGPSFAGTGTGVVSVVALVALGVVGAAGVLRPK